MMHLWVQQVQVPRHTFLLGMVAGGLGPSSLQVDRHGAVRARQTLCPYIPEGVATDHAAMAAHRAQPESSCCLADLGQNCPKTSASSPSVRCSVGPTAGQDVQGSGREATPGTCAASRVGSLYTSGGNGQELLVVLLRWISEAKYF